MRLFFSSRRRHTRFDCDWSSDVCSSDLAMIDRVRARLGHALPLEFRMDAAFFQRDVLRLLAIRGCAYAIKVGYWSWLPLKQLAAARRGQLLEGDRKSTRLNSSHSQISYAVFCFRKKKSLTVH